MLKLQARWGHKLRVRNQMMQTGESPPYLFLSLAWYHRITQHNKTRFRDLYMKNAARKLSEATNMLQQAPAKELYTVWPPSEIFKKNSWCNPTGMNPYSPQFKSSA